MLRLFQSTPPVKAATMAAQASCSLRVFQSTPPVKAATAFGQHVVGNRVFQSTPPVKAATLPLKRKLGLLSISIHAAREGGDPPSAWCCLLGYISIHAAREGGDGAKAVTLHCPAYFNPRRP